ncbi:class II fructose-bisphosphate aldolase [Brevibacterium sp.]|uniref:class II fructose-bisphosphate aldolase n=1 Tax=Brevibacterium sp. TaxID=1701 RepID=UPI002811766C|nr:class II fructose-bisphosphate aldolase [Brevibacterium sp.]
MSKTSLRELLTAAAPSNTNSHGSAVGAFNVVHLESAEAIAAGAEAAGRPVIMQISENCVKYHGGLAPIARATLAIAETAVVPVAVHLDHATDPALIDEAIDLGFDSVMFDGAHLDYELNCSTTAEVVRRAHARGIDVEAELGEIGGKDGAHAPGVRTDPGEAARFVSATGVDALAVAVGSSHAMVERTSRLDLDLIARLAEALPVPLVLHGSSGVADSEIRRGIRAGMRKINISTHLVKVFTASVRDTLTASPELVDSRKYLGPAREAFAAEVTRLIGVLSSETALSPEKTPVSALAKPAGDD